MKKISYLSTLVIILFCLSFRFLNFKSVESNFWNVLKTKKANQENHENQEIQNIIIYAYEKLKVTKIYKLPIGKIFIQNQWMLIDAFGNLFQMNLVINPLYQNLITVEGDYKKWPVYYNQLNKFGILDKVYFVNIYNQRIDLWILPGLLIQIGSKKDDITLFIEFFKTYPAFFNKFALIDFRETKRIGITQNYFKNFSSNKEVE